MLERTAVLVFTTLDEDKNYTFKVKDIKEEITKTELETFMDYLVSSQILQTDGSAINGKASCRVDTVTTTTMEF